MFKVAILVFLFSVGSASATVINGLDWARLSETVNMTYAEAGIWGSANNYRYASNVEVLSLLDSYISGLSTIEVAGYDTATTEGIATTRFIADFGASSSDPNFHYGRYIDENMILRMAGVNTGFLVVPIIWFGGASNLVFDTTSTDDTHIFGAFMVKNEPNQVPESSILALMGLGLIGMFGVNRRKVQS